MATYTIQAAQAELEILVDRAEAGENIEILSPKGGLVRIVPLTADEKARLADEPIE